MRHRVHPVILGKGMRKGIVFGKTESLFGEGREFFIVKTKKQWGSGSEFPNDDIDKVDCYLHFCDRETLKLTIDALSKMLEGWEGGEQDVKVD